MSGCVRLTDSGGEPVFIKHSILFYEATFKTRKAHALVMGDSTQAIVYAHTEAEAKQLFPQYSLTGSRSGLDNHEY